MVNMVGKRLSTKLPSRSKEFVLLELLELHSKKDFPQKLSVF